VVDLLERAGPTRGVLAWVRRSTAPPGPRRIQLRVWDWWSPSTTEDYARYFAEIESIFEARHPDVDVVFQAVPFGNYEQKLATALLGDNPPDVFQCSVYWAEGFYNRGMLRQLNDLIATTPELQDDQFVPAALHHTRRGTHVFGVPHILDGSCLLWNLDMLRTDPNLHGVFERGPDGALDFRRIRFDAVRDWAHFRRIAKQLTKYDPAAPGQPLLDDRGDVVQAGYAVNAYGMGAGPFMPWASTNGVRFQDRAGTKALFDTPAAAQTLQFLIDLYWKDRVCPPFRRELVAYDQFQEGRVACVLAGTWSGKYLVRNTQGWMGFGLTALPPGPNATGYKTMTWANMMVISSGCREVETAWEFIRFLCGLEGSLLKLKRLEQNSPRRDVYRSEAWDAAVKERPYLQNVPRICTVGDPLQHTQIQAVEDEVEPIFEYVLLNWPEIEVGRGRFGSVADALHLAAERVNEVYDRYGHLVRRWDAQLGRRVVQEED